jgi:DnaK suppressor protein
MAKTVSNPKTKTKPKAVGPRAVARLKAPVKAASAKKKQSKPLGSKASATKTALPAKAGAKSAGLKANAAKPVAARSAVKPPVKSKIAAKPPAKSKPAMKVAKSKASAPQKQPKALTAPILAPSRSKANAARAADKTNPGKSGTAITAPRNAQSSNASIRTSSNGASHPLTISGAAATKPNVVSSAGKVMSKKSNADLTAVKLPDDYRPSDDEPFMSTMQRAYFRQKLQKWKDDIIRETMETLQVLHDDTLQHPDLADRATHETDRALDLRARDRQRKLISKIEAAIRRIDDGSYGYCDETGEPISLKRLDARPVATLTLEAQERHERRERVHREE